MITYTALDRLAQQNPHPHNASPLDPAAEERLRLILDTERTPSDLSVRRRRRAPMIAVAAAAVAVFAAGAGIVWSGGDGAAVISASPSFVLPAASGDPFELVAGGANTGATPLEFVSFDRPVTADEYLRSLAHVAASRPEVGKPGSFDYIRLREWGFFTSRDQNGSIIDHGISDMTREDWRSEDGSGLMISTQDGHSDSVLVPPQPTRESDRIVDGNTVADIRDGLLATHSASMPPASWLEEYAQQWYGHVLTPSQNAAYLEVLADVPGIEVVGETADRAGRRGVAISAETDDIRTVLITNPDTGDLLDIERIALTPIATEIPVATPSTITYVVFESRGRTATVGERP